MTTRDLAREWLRNVGHFTDPTVDSLAALLDRVAAAAREEGRTEKPMTPADEGG
jgi:hypothetical protein